MLSLACCVLAQEWSLFEPWSPPVNPLRPWSPRPPAPGEPDLDPYPDAFDPPLPPHTVMGNVFPTDRLRMQVDVGPERGTLSGPFTGVMSTTMPWFVLPYVAAGRFLLDVNVCLSCA